MNIDRAVWLDDRCYLARYFEECNEVLLKADGAYAKRRAFNLKMKMFAKWELRKKEEK